MKKTLLLILLMNMSTIFPSYAQNNAVNVSNNYLELQQLKYGKNLIPVGEITSKITDNIILKPDTVEFYVTLETEGETPTEASNLNVETMKKLKTYLNTLNITDDNLVTTDYKNSVRTITKPDSKNNTTYAAILNVVLTIDNNDSFINLNKILDKYGINNIYQIDDKNLTNYYEFSIATTSNRESRAKDDLYKDFNNIANELKKIGLTNVSIKKYMVREMEAKEIEEKHYFVNNTLKIKINKLDLIGKIIAKAQELKMQVNNNISYSVSPEAIQAALNEHETLLLNKLSAKVERLLDKQYVLGAPITLSLDSRDFDTSYSSFNNAKSQKRYLGMDRSVDDAMDVDINTPPEYEVTLTLSGTFETLKKVEQK